MFKKILVPLDGSEMAERALEPALALAQPANGEIILLSIPYLKHALVQERSGMGFLLPHQSIELTRKELIEYQEALRQSRQLPGVELRTKILVGDEAGAIVDTATSEEVELIVMSTHGRSGLSRWVMGSVTERVLRSSPCPVLVVRRAELPTRLLIPLDGSALAESALTPGFELAQRLGAQVTLLQVQEPMVEGIAVAARVPWEERAVAEAQTYLRDLADRHAAEAMTVETAVVVDDAARGILEYTEENNVSLIVMATHGYTGLRRWVYGSVTEKVLRGVHCAIMILRPPSNTLKEEVADSE